MQFNASQMEERSGPLGACWFDCGRIQEEMFVLCGVVGQVINVTLETVSWPCFGKKQQPEFKFSVVIHQKKKSSILCNSVRDKSAKVNSVAK